MLYEDVFERLEREGVGYVVVGGVALALHGFDRRPADLDIVVDGTPDESQRTTDILVAAGFVPSIPLPLCDVTVLRMTDQAGREIDVFARFHVPFAELLAGSARLPCGDTLARVASLADIIRAKQLTGRPADLLEAEQLLASAVPPAPRTV